MTYIIITMDTIKINQLDNNDLENIEKLFELMQIKWQIDKKDINMNVMRAFELINSIEADTTHLKSYPEFKRAKHIVEN